MRGSREDNRKIKIEIALVSVLVLFIFAALFDFTKENNERIIRQNEQYVESVTVQKAMWIGDFLSLAQSNVENMAYLYGETLTSPDVDLEELAIMQEFSGFDYVEYADRNGKNINANGETSEASDRKYYIEGMQGNTGCSLVFHSRITDETLLCFYAPVRYGGEITGVVMGIYSERGIRKILTTKFFDIQARTFLCMQDGTVVFSSGDAAAPENVLQTFPDSMRVSDEIASEIRDAFETQSSYGYRYVGSQGTGNAYVTAVPNSDWMLIQSFPSAVTDSMVHEANIAGIRLEAELVLAFGIYIICLLWLSWKQKKRLVLEKQEISQIVDSVTELYHRFIVIDFKRDTYEYLKNPEDSILSKGCLAELVAYLEERKTREENGEAMSRIITREYLQEHLRGNITYLQFEYRTANGNPEWENMSILCLNRERGTVNRVLLAIQDVSALKEAEERSRVALKEAFQAADGANRAKSSFLSQMSHDIRTPMNAIMGMTSVALMHMDDRERVTDCLNKIALSSRHLLALINDVLDMSKIESGKVSLSEDAFELSGTVESLLAIIQPQVEAKGQELDIRVSDITHNAVIGDSMRLQQVFVNVMGNAVKFTSKGGKIMLRIREKPSYVAGSGCYEFVCEDTGVGMEPEFLDRIFEPFTRAESARQQNIEGTGLGMSIVKNIVRMMNGDIQVESRLGEGSRFTIRLYLKLQDTAAQNGQPSGGQFESGRSEIDELAQSDYSGRRVLLVEDNELNIEIAEELLECAGLEVEKACDGQQAVETVLRKPEHYYDLIFMDIQMPVKNGYEAASAIRDSGRGDLETIPIIAMSADAFSDDIQRAMAAGMNDHVAKPIELSKLLTALAKWMK